MIVSLWLNFIIIYFSWNSHRSWALCTRQGMFTFLDTWYHHLLTSRDAALMNIRLRSHVTACDSYPGNSMRIGLEFTPFLPYPGNLPFYIHIMFIRHLKWRTNLSSEHFSQPRHLWTACPGRIKKEMCERKAYPHKICPNRNRIRYVWTR